MGVKLPSYKDSRGEQARQIIDVEQIFATYGAARAEFGSRYAGSMSWKTINGGVYLYRKVKGSSRSLGVQSPETEDTHRAFHEGRIRLKDRLVRLTARLDEMAPVSKASGIGRIPATNARVLREIASAGLMGNAIDVVGTNALYAYERMCGVQVDSGLLATGDIDLLFDARSNLKLASSDLRSEGLMGLLRKLDGSFAPTGSGSFRAVNIVTERLPHLAFDGQDLSAMPLAMRRAAWDILPMENGSDDASGSMEPNW